MAECRGFVMMSPFPAWRLEDNEDVRPGAQIEIVIDLQLRVLEGCRLFQTQSGALQTFDWISNRNVVYAFDRFSSAPVWANRAYPGHHLHPRRHVPRISNGPATLRSIAPSASLWMHRWDVAKVQNDHVCNDGARTAYGVATSVWPSAASMRQDKRYWESRASFDTQTLIKLPTIVYPNCSARHPDGVVRIALSAVSALNHTLISLS